MKHFLCFQPELIRDEGYPAEVHSVTTCDGYILQLHRIPFSPKSPKTKRSKTPIFLMHGFLESSNGWIVLGSENSLGENSYKKIIKIHQSL